jgi:hypothetical protein
MRELQRQRRSRMIYRRLDARVRVLAALIAVGERA